MARARSNFLVTLLCLSGSLASGSETGEEPARQLLERRCIRCHGPEEQKSQLRLDSLPFMLLGGIGGPAINPAAPAESHLLRAIHYEDESLRMPPEGRLPVEEIQILDHWLQQAWDPALLAAAEGQAAALLQERLETDAKLWAFRQVHRPEVPTALSQWVRSPIDAFALKSMLDHGLTPSAEADRRTLIRRLYLDVLGLPPTPDAVTAFEQDATPGAYEKLVDDVLASPQYGERWARHWLDVVRFAETNGFETNTPRPNAWPYRDYVIQSFNEDKPYTRFIREQLAGDALGVEAATGFLVAGPWDEVKSPDIVLTKNQRDNELHDMASTIGGAFLGLTVGCAKCHNHKFDPISQEDYYGLRAAVEGVQHGERELRPPDAEERLKQAEALQSQLALLDRHLESFAAPANVAGLTMGQLAANAEPASPEALRPAPDTRKNIERFAPTRAKYIRFTIFETTDNEPCLDELEVWTAGDQPANVALAAAGGKATASSEYAGSDKHKIAHLNEGAYGNDHSWIPAGGQMGWAQIELSEPVLIDRVIWGRARDAAFRDRIPVRYAVEVAESPDAWTLVASGWDRAKRGDEQNKPPLYRAGNPEQQQALETLQAERDRTAKQIEALKNFPRIYAGRFEAPGPTHLLYRGDAMMERQAVAPGGINYVQPPLHLSQDTPEQQRRIALAAWIANDQNPLTARVMVNRLWQHHFGQGIVATPSDFGAMGARPTHPELLDWLAAEFMANGWRMKPIHRLILLSSTYRQSGTPRSEALKRDAGTQWLWRFPPRRLEAEPIRDSILRVSGVLDPRMGGPGYSAFEPNENYVRVYTPKSAYGPEEWRRMIYQTKPRSQQDDTFGAFDCPDGGQTQPRRNTSTTPLQALNLLNSPFMLQQADLLAERLKRDAGQSLDAKIIRAFQLALQREPDAQELSAASQLVQDHGLAAFCRGLYNTNEFLYLE